jgi:hypothetical protein
MDAKTVEVEAQGQVEGKIKGQGETDLEAE